MSASSKQQLETLVQFKCVACCCLVLVHLSKARVPRRTINVVRLESDELCEGATVKLTQT